MYQLYQPELITRAPLDIAPAKPYSGMTCVLTPRQLLMKRTLDIVVALIALALTLPVMVAVAIAIRLDSEGPVLFKQKRVGLNGRLFTIYKFRSMVRNAEALQSAVTVVDERGQVMHKVRDDFRVTRVGKVIRKLSLDELPQLFNVLKGEMSLVGPRPELPWLVQENYDGWQRRRFSVPQGVTGWWQITGRSDAPLHLNTDKDIWYIENWSIWLDVYIIVMTIPALLKQKGAF